MPKITIHSIESIKNEAQKSTKSEPEYSNKLNSIAKSRFKVRNFNEAKAICKKNVDSYLSKNENLSTCRFCGFSFKTDSCSDTKKHYKIHLKAEKDEFKQTNSVKFDTTKKGSIKLSKTNISNFGIPELFKYIEINQNEFEFESNQISSFRQTVFYPKIGSNFKCSGIRAYHSSGGRVLDLVFSEDNGEYKRVLTELKECLIEETPGHTMEQV